jgi:hypothetical protein
MERAGLALTDLRYSDSQNEKRLGVNTEPLIMKPQ